MKVLIVGSGGREHALAWKLSRSPKAQKLWCAPGNPGIERFAECVNISADDIDGLLKFAKANAVDLTVVGPEDPLCAGIVDRFTQAGLKIFGPDKAAARIEGDKAFCKELMRLYQVPTAESRTFERREHSKDEKEELVRNQKELADKADALSKELSGNPAQPFALSAKQELDRALAAAHQGDSQAAARCDQKAAEALTRLAEQLKKEGHSAGYWAASLGERSEESARQNLDFDPAADAIAYIRSRRDIPVIKAAGLAKGKGVFVPDNQDQAISAVRKMLCDDAFGPAGRKVVIEDRLHGEEVSILALTDGSTIYVLEACQDHKAVHDGDKGPNTGGMGAYCPTPAITDELIREVERTILVPIVHGLKSQGCPYKGVLYAGLMITRGGPKVLEFNARFGDPETQPLLMRLKSDLLPVLESVVDGTLHRMSLEWDPRPAVCVVMCSKGYPDNYEKGKPIQGLAKVQSSDSLMVFHAGTQRTADWVTTAGGRVLGVTAMGTDIADARKRAYEAVGKIHFDGAHWRTDIGAKALNR